MNPNELFLIFAEPRGGSTWLEELVRTIPKSVTIWEPLMISEVPQVADLGFAWRQPIPEKESWPEAKAFFNELFHGRILSPYLTHPNSCQELRDGENFIIKFCRGNLMLPWLVKEFELRPPVVLLRHPCAVVSSQSKYGAWTTVNAPTDLPSMRFDDVFRTHQELIDSLETAEEKLAVYWAVSTKHIMEHPLNDVAWITVTYEEMVMDGEAVLRKIFGRWNMEIPDGALNKLREPSKTSIAGSQAHDPESQLRLWKSRLTSEQQQRILTILEKVGVELYDEGVMPTRSFIGQSTEHS